MMAWIEPVTSRIGGEQYTHTDLNRVGNNVQYLADLLNGYGYAVTVNPKTDWQGGDDGDIPSSTQMTQYITDVAAIKAAFYGTVTLPTTMKNLTHEQANNIERLILEIEEHLAQMAAAFRYCGELICGEDQ